MTHPPILGIIFDMDGVLFHSEPEYMRLMGQLMEEEGYPVSREALLATIGTSMEETCRILREDAACPLDIPQMIAIHAAWAPYNPISYQDVLEKDALPTLSALHQKGYKLGLASSSGRQVIEGALKDAGLRGFFSCVVSSDDVLHKKPDPECYLQAARHLGLDPARCLAVEDTGVGLAAAKAAGMRALGRVREEYAQDFSRADGLVHSLGQVLAWLGA